MLFLFNDVVFDLGDEQETALSSGAAHGFDQGGLFKMRVGKVVKMIREAVFEEPHLPRTNPDVAAFLTAMLAWKTGEANALLAVAPRHIEDPSQVQMRVASVSLVTMSQLLDLQGAGQLSSHSANLSVWRHAPQRMQA
jgi:hypothetical protein